MDFEARVHRGGGRCLCRLLHGPGSPLFLAVWISAVARAFNCALLLHANNQKTRINWADDHEFGATLARFGAV